MTGPCLILNSEKEKKGKRNFLKIRRKEKRGILSRASNQEARKMPLDTLLFIA
jgi:hypothetical protein